MKDLTDIRKTRRLFRNMVISLFFLPCTLLTNSVQADSNKSLSNYMWRLGFEPATDENLYCRPSKKRNANTDYPHADYMFDLASANRTLIFVHGFIPTKFGGKHSLQGMVDVWKQHIKIAKQLPKTTYCVVTWDTEYGFDDNNYTLSRFLSSLFLAKSDKLFQQKRHSTKTPLITLVGHSAGGNYIKFSYNQHRQYLRDINIDRNLYAKKVDIRVLTLGTPHLGTPYATDAMMYTTMGQLFLELLGYKDAAKGVSGFTRKATSRGAFRLLPVSQNRPLADLNKLFASQFPKRDIFAVGSAQDKYVSLTSATPSFTTPFSLSGTHDDFLRPEKDPGFANALKQLYLGRRPQ